MFTLPVYCLVISVAPATQIQNPLTDFIELNPQFQGEYHDLSEIEVVRLDLSGDSVPEILIRNTAVPGDRSGAPWVVYQVSGQEFRRIGNTAYFRPDSGFAGVFDGFEDTQLYNYASHGSDGGTYAAIRLVNGEIRNDKIREVDRSESSPDRAWLERAFRPIEPDRWRFNLSDLDDALTSEILDYASQDSNSAEEFATEVDDNRGVEEGGDANIGSDDRSVREPSFGRDVDESQEQSQEETGNPLADQTESLQPSRISFLGTVGIIMGATLLLSLVLILVLRRSQR